jgi:signal transduction histidine kinase
VVISDYDMPGMNGAQFLRQAREVAPETVRMILSGRAGFAEAMQIINEGYIFRFLSKPCSPEAMIQAIDEAAEQHRLRTADRMLLERRVAEVSSQLLRAERLATLGSLATGVGHELANLATIFQGVVLGVKDAFEAKTVPEQQDINELERLSEHLKQHAKHLLNLGRPRVDTVDVVDLVKVVGETLDLLKVVGKIKRLEVAFEAPSGELLVKTSRMQLEQVLLNLIGNAADAIESIPDRPGKITVRVASEAGCRAACSISDNGCGIPEATLAQIFEPYFTTKPVGKGTGLGLAVVKQILEGYGSAVRVESRAGEGTTFSFSLPLEVEEESLSAHAAPAASEAGQARRAS